MKKQKRHRIPYNMWKQIHKEYEAGTGTKINLPALKERYYHGNLEAVKYHTIVVKQFESGAKKALKAFNGNQDLMKRVGRIIKNSNG
jgi:hypothetical protein